MKLLKKITLGLLVAVSSMGITSVANAAAGVVDEDGRVVFTPAGAIDNVSAKIAEAVQAIQEGSHMSSEIADIIRDASRLNKEINANDLVDRHRQKANGHLKKARKAAKKGNLAEAKKHLDIAAPAFVALKGYL